MDNRNRVSRVPTSPTAAKAGATIARKPLPKTPPVSKNLKPDNLIELSDEPEPVEKTGKKKPKKPWTKQRKISLATLIIGLIVLLSGIGFLVYNLLKTPSASDAEYLVEVGQWQRADAPSVIWNFTKIGEGRLSTNSGDNEYDFEWAFEDGKLKIDTDWLYELNDEYEFSINQNESKFTLKNGDETIEFIKSKD